MVQKGFSILLAMCNGTERFYGTVPNWYRCWYWFLTDTDVDHIFTHSRHPLEQTPPMGPGTPHAQCMLGDSHQAGGMHPTGMQSCANVSPQWNSSLLDTSWCANNAGNVSFMWGKESIKTTIVTLLICATLGLLSHPCNRSMTLELLDSVVRFECGITFTRTWRVTDDCQNPTSLQQTLRVLDDLNPVSPPNGQLELAQGPKTPRPISIK